MKKICGFFISLFLLGCVIGAVDFEVGLGLGYRSIVDPDINDAYGSGIVYLPHFNVTIYKNIRVGAGYEGGYNKKGRIGIYEEEASLKISGFEIFVSYQFQIKKMFPYIKAGYGFYSYRQNIESDYVDDVDENKSGFLISAGLKYYCPKGFYVGAELKYVPLKVQPLNEQVDLSGFRGLFLIGYRFDI